MHACAMVMAQGVWGFSQAHLSTQARGWDGSVRFRGSQMRWRKWDGFDVLSGDLRRVAAAVVVAVAVAQRGACGVFPSLFKHAGASASLLLNSARRVMGRRVAGCDVCCGVGRFGWGGARRGGDCGLAAASVGLSLSLSRSAGLGVCGGCLGGLEVCRWDGVGLWGGSLLSSTAAGARGARR